MAKTIQNKTRLSDTVKDLEKLLILLKAAENDEITLTQIGKEYELRPQALNSELQTSFSTYFKSRIRYINNDELETLINTLKSPSDKIIEKIFAVESDKKVVFPDYNKENFWSVIKKYLPDKYYNVLTKHVGYECEPMNYEEIGKTLDLTRARVMQIDNAAIAKLCNSSVLTEIFYSDYIDKTNELALYKQEKSEDLDKAYTEFSKLKTYLDMLPDVENIIKYIEQNYPELSSDKINTAVIDVFNKSIDSLNFSVRTLNALTAAGYITINDLYNANAIDIISIKNLGKSSIKEIVDVLDKQEATHPNWENLKHNIEKCIQ